MTTRIRQLLIEAKAGLDPWETIPQDRLAAVARRCGEIEVGEIIAELDALAHEKRAAPDWDGDTRDDIAKTQELYSRVLGLVGADRLGGVAMGLLSEEAETRLWVLIALELHGSAALPALSEAIEREASAPVRQALVAAIRRLEG